MASRSRSRPSAASVSDMALVTAALHGLGLVKYALAFRRAGLDTPTAVLAGPASQLQVLGLDPAAVVALRRALHPSAQLTIVPRAPSASSPSCGSLELVRTRRPPLRSDHPPLDHTARGSRAAIAEALATPAGRELALAAVDRDVYAPSSR
eukprot:16435683-Heterocapsa_arctica.AAC.1